METSGQQSSFVRIDGTYSSGQILNAFPILRTGTVVRPSSMEEEGGYLFRVFTHIKRYQSESRAPAGET